MAGPVRQPIDLESLTRYIEKHVPEIKLPISIKQFGFGQSNPTYLLTSPTSTPSQFVLRKKPPGTLLSTTAHQVDREHRVISALAPTAVPVPRTYTLCNDTAIIGTAFYIMEFLDGRIFEDASFPDLSPHDRKECWRQAVITLAALHRVDVERVGLQDFGRRKGFYNRQLKTLGRVAASQASAVDVETGKKVGQIPHFDAMVEFFGEEKTQPRDRGGLIHGDYKIDNLVFHKTETRVIGILDWEMSTIGHPLSDLANLLSPYTFAVSLPTSTSSALSNRVNAAFIPSAKTPGLPTRDECMTWYAETAGWDPRPEMAWGDAFGVFRNSVIMQGIAARYALRQASSAKAHEYALQMGPFGEFAWWLVGKCIEGVGRKEKAKL